MDEEPEKAEIARTRKVQRNQAGGKKTVRGQKDPKVSAYKRVSENRNEFLNVTSKNMLRCDACKETISKKKSTVRKHINAVKHNDAKRAIQKSKKTDQSLLTFLRRKDEKDNPKGETLPDEMRLFRFDLVEAFLSAGIPLSKIDHLRSFLEKYGHRLTAHGHLSQMIPSIMEKEKETLKTELSLVDGCSVIFDGSTRLGEALAIVVRFVDDEWNVQQRLIRLQVLAKSLKANELAQCLIQSLAVEYSIRPGVLLAAMKDGAAVNHAALEQVKFFFPQLLEITCFSHTIDNVGKHFEFRVLERFSQLWVSMFSHSAAVRLAWKTRTGTAMKLYYLGEYTTGKAQTMINGLLGLQTEDAYKRARNILNDRFGNPFKVYEAYRQKLRAWPVCSTAAKLQEFNDFLVMTEETMKTVKYLKEFDNYFAIRELAARLPTY